MHTAQQMSIPEHPRERYYAPTLGMSGVDAAWAPRGAFSLVLMIGEVEQRHRFAYALHRAMTVRGMSGRQLAKELGLDPRKVTGWLKEKGLPNLYESQALAHALNVNEDLFRNPPEVPAPPPEPYYPIGDYLIGAVEQATKRASSRPLPAPGATPAPASGQRPSRRSAAR